MPLSRYEIRNEYSLADPDLYGVADKDDPEALLEVVAMSGLVGVLRQLGDLAEFAAEIFHGLHEEVMATAARGHGLIVRLQQLEAEFPSIEKRLLAQMSHTDFLYSSGVDWHPNLHMNQNSITGGDLPRFIMDSYEECHGPPRLFLLDKFDVAGAGACLKRYTDPSFFKVEAACYGITKSEVQREKRTRKVKRRGQQWRNGESSEPIPSSHAKLHQLLLEEQFENGGNDPEHRVKLKKREMTKSPLDEIAGKSYMEKFLETCLLEREMSISSPCMDLTSNNTCESGLEIVEIGTVSPARESLEKERIKCSSLNIKEMLVKPSLDELNELIDEESIGVSGSNYESNSDKNLSTISKMISPEELAVYAESKSEYSLDENNSAEAASDLDNYMDAIAMMESETETSECRTSKNSHFVCRIVADSDASEGHDELQMALLDSQSVGNTIESDPANISLEESGSFLCSHTVSILAESTPLNGVAAIFSTPTSGTATAETSSDHQSISEEASGNKTQYASCSSTHVEAVEIQKYTPISDEASFIACNSDQNMSLQSADAVVSLDENSTLGLELYGKFCNSNLVHMSRDTYQRRESQSAIVSHSIALSDAIPHARDHILVSAEGHPVDVMACENSEISSIALQDLPNRSDASEDNRSTGSINKVLETEPANNGSLPNMADGMMSSSLSVRSHGNKLNFKLGLQEVETCSDVVSTLKNPPVSASDHLEIMKPAYFAAEENHCIPSTEENSEKLPLFLQPAQSCSLVELHPSEITDAGLLPPHYLPEEAVRVDGYEHSNREISTATETEVMMTSMLSGKQSKIMSDASEENLSSGSFNEVLQTGTANDVCLPTNSVGSPGNKWTHDLGWPEIEACLDNASLQKNAPISSSRCPEITKPVDLAVEENHCIPPTRENSENPPLFLDPAQSGCPVGQHPSEIIDVDLLAQHYFPEEAAPVDGNEQSNNSNISTATETKEMMTSMLSVDQSKIMSDASEENLSSGSFDEVLQTGPTNDGCLPNLVYGMICSPDSVGLHGDRWTHDLSWTEVEACLDVGSLLNNVPVSTCSYAEITKPADVAVEENHCIPSTEENLENLPLFLDPAQSCSPVEQNPFETIDAGLSPLHYLPDGAASANGYEVSNKGIPAAIENVEMIAYMSQVVQSETTTDFSEENCSSRTFNEVLQTGRGNDGLLPNLVDGMMGSPHSFSSPGDKRIHDLGWPAVDACLDVASLLDNASVSASCPEIVKPADLAVEEDHCIPSTEENSANLCHSSRPEQNCSLVVKNPSKASLSPLHYLPEDAASANGDEVSNRGIPTAIENAEMIASMLPADPSETMSDAYEDNHGAGSFNEVLQTVSANDGSLRDLADGIMGTICSVSSGHLCTCDSNQQEVEACLDDASPLFSSPVSTSSSPGVTKLAGSAPEGGHILSTEEHSEGLLLLEPAQSCRPLDMHTSEITDADCSPHLNLPEKAAPVCRYELSEKTLENELMAASVSSVKQSEIPDPVSGPLQTHINLLADEIHAGPTDPSCSEIYMLSMLPTASEINPEEMPPLPPLPPMQWRLGKLQHACLPKERPMMEHAHGPVKLIPAPAVDCNEEIFPLASMAEKAKGVNPLLSLSKIEDENFPNISVYSRGYMVPGTFTQPMISMEQQNALNVDRQLDNPLYSTHVTCVRSTNGLPTPEMEPNQPNSNLLEPGLTIKNLLLGPVGASVNGKEIQPEVAIIYDQLQHFPSVTVQESMKPSGQFMLVPTMIYEQKPPQGFMASEEVTTWLSNTSNAIRASEDGNANGTLQKKIPRPRNPLIDEVVALDKSKLRKVGERVQVVEKAEERDTLLEQIRNKSVNLKPAATTRPSIQGPKTNLKVAAILEKANTIRQAMAGSDEDDSDSWSDS